MDGNEALKLSARLAPPHDPLAPSRRLARVFGTVVQALMRAVLDTRHERIFRRPVGLQFVDDHDPGRATLRFRQLAHLPGGSLGIAAASHENVEHEAILVDSAPEPAFLPTDRDDVLVQVPIVTELSGRAPANVIGEVPAEFLNPEPDRLVRGR